MKIQVNKLGDIDAVLGKQLSRELIKLVTEGKSYLRKKPFQIQIVESKPAFYLGDYDTLTCYAVDMQAGQIVGEKYCGSYDSALNHQAEQFSEGFQVESGKALIFVTVICSKVWEITIVSSDTIKQVANAA
jgi:hypothetical protein